MSGFAVYGVVSMTNLLGGSSGEGKKVSKLEKCKECSGLGAVEVPSGHGSDNMDCSWEDCEACKGKGFVWR